MKQNAIVISGVSAAHTPVVKYAIQELSMRYTCIVITYTHKKIFSFIYHSLKVIFTTKNIGLTLFIQGQSLPLLFILQYFTNQKYYWALESYKFKMFNSSLAIKTLYFERLIKWNDVSLIVPSKERLRYFSAYKYKRTFIVENTPLVGSEYRERVIHKGEKLKFVIYGSLDNKNIYIQEFLTIAKLYTDRMELHLIGWGFQYQNEIQEIDNVFYHGTKTHSELTKILERFHVSVIGYRPITFNNKYCAPNKLFECFSLSLPVLANSNNPTLQSIMAEEKYGRLYDFSQIQDGFEKIIDDFASKLAWFGNNCFKAYNSKYNFENYFNHIINDSTFIEYEEDNKT